MARHLLLGFPRRHRVSFASHDAAASLPPPPPPPPPRKRSRDTFTVTQETILLVGLLDGFTTYSTFAFHSAEMLSHGRFLTAAAYILGTNLSGLAAVWAGLWLFGRAG